MDTRLLRVLNNREQNYPRALEYHFPHILEKIMALWDSSECEAYLCGSAGLIDSAIKVLTDLGTREEAIFYDKFE